MQILLVFVRFQNENLKNYKSIQNPDQLFSPFLFSELFIVRRLVIHICFLFRIHLINLHLAYFRLELKIRTQPNLYQM